MRALSNPAPNNDLFKTRDTARTFFSGLIQDLPLAPGRCLSKGAEIFFLATKRANSAGS
jgi:hypothetical protein